MTKGLRFWGFLVSRAVLGHPHQEGFIPGSGEARACYWYSSKEPHLSYPQWGWMFFPTWICLMSSSSCSFIPTSALPPCLAQRKYPSFVSLHENIYLLGISCTVLPFLPLPYLESLGSSVSSSVLFSLGSYCMLLPGCMGLKWWCFGPLVPCKSTKPGLSILWWIQNRDVQLTLWLQHTISVCLPVPLPFFYLFNSLFSIDKIPYKSQPGYLSLPTWAVKSCDYGCCSFFNIIWYMRWYIYLL